ncbi:MAG: hypothetical protein J6U12_03535 [Candidatus Methanomethylophilaceae archaeon]|nr:hypothetical protein [Candidatus Methanomethylophilaceae archaeon]MBP5685950.1 hypothetical protein [Candidatus Methanomethylophilaceae archaeon]MBP5735688.1 hypothetical protein [Candidatus Methanomethylophilaceae archaeon]
MGEETLGSKGAALMMCVVLIAGSLVMFALYQGMSSTHPDPHEEVQTLAVTGTMMGEECYGDCTIEYVPETGEYRVYQGKSTITSASCSKDIEFGIVFGSDDLPLKTSYKCIGTERIGDIETTVWTHSENKTDYTFYIGDLCRTLRMVVTNEDFSITGDLKE